MSTYACSDLHGDWNLWIAIKNFLKEDDKLFYLGDATDRGPDGWAILKEMLNDSRIFYIAGNHDIMLANRIANPDDSEIAHLHNINQGYCTWEDAKNDPEAKEIEMKIRQLPLYTIYENINNLKIFMSHSGSTNIQNPDDLLWDRKEYSKIKNDSEYDIIVHGHMTIPYLIDELKMLNAFIAAGGKTPPKWPEWESGAYWYHGYRCDIDCCTSASHQTVLLNLDTFEEKKF